MIDNGELITFAHNRIDQLFTGSVFNFFSHSNPILPNSRTLPDPDPCVTDRFCPFFEFSEITSLFFNDNLTNTNEYLPFENGTKTLFDQSHPENQLNTHLAQSTELIKM